ncbi:MAG: hypothetical protein MJ166_03760 [Clostridia bacterium]|nr:hypothetical protein [Clostridia bacterium]
MADTKIIVGSCSKTGKRFVIEARKELMDYKAINFIELPKSEGSKLRSDIAVTKIVSGKNLIPCRYCGSRKVSGCNCSQIRRQCRSTDAYDFQCMYCGSMTIEQPKSANPKIYVSPAHYDDIGEVLGSMNLTYKPYPNSLDCDVLFINCGSHIDVSASDLTNFVRNGGCLYASDLASEYISKSFPGLITYTNTGKTGKVMADVVDEELMQIIGNKIEINFDLPVWSVVSSTKGKVLLKGAAGTSYSGIPIMISQTYGNGTVFYTSFHNHSQASEKEKMLLQLLLLKQFSSNSDMTLEQMGALMGLNISAIKRKFGKE